MDMIQFAVKNLQDDIALLGVDTVAFTKIIDGGRETGFFFRKQETDIRVNLFARVVKDDTNWFVQVDKKDRKLFTIDISTESTAYDVDLFIGLCDMLKT